jgi:hypothetical protein
LTVFIYYVSEIHVQNNDGDDCYGDDNDGGSGDERDGGVNGGSDGGSDDDHGSDTGGVMMMV